MALQENNLMLLDDSGFPRTIDGATDSIGISTDVVIGGDLTVNGDIVSGGTMDVVVTDNFIDLSNGNVTGAKSGGLTINVEAVANTSMAAGVTFESQATANAAPGFAPGAGVAAMIITGFNPGAAGLTPGDIIEISGLSDLGENSGLFTVLTADNAVGNVGTKAGVITVKNANAASVPFCQTNFEDGAESAGVLGFQLDLGIITISGGALPDGAGGTITKGNFATGYAVSATDAAAPGAGSITYGDAASVSLQEAYDEGQSIQISNLGNLTIETDEATPRDFIVRKGGTPFPYLQTDAASDKLILGFTNGATPEVKIDMMGELATGIMFDGVNPYTIANQSAAGVQNQLTIAGKTLDLQGAGAGANDMAKLTGNGIGSTASLQANNVYAGGASVAGDITGEIYDADGVPSALTLTFPAGAGDLAALIAGATIPGTVTLSDDGGRLKITSVATGVRVWFNIQAESVLGVAAGVGLLGIPGFVGSSMGEAAVYLAANNADMQVRTGRHLDMMSMNGSLELRSQTVGQGISLLANSGTLVLSGDTEVLLQSAAAANIMGQAINIDGMGVGGTVTIGGVNPAPTNVTAKALTMVGDTSSSLSVAGVDQTLTLQATGGGAPQKVIMTSAGTAADAVSISSANGGVSIFSTNSTVAVEGNGVGIDSIGANTLALKSEQDILVETANQFTAIQLKGWVQQDYTASAGMGVEVTLRTSGGLASVIGEVFAFKNDGAANEAMSVSAASPEAPGVCGSFLENGIVAGGTIKASTVQGAVVTLSFDGGGFPGAGEVGTPVYLSSTLGKASKLATTVGGEHVIRLGFAMEAGTGRVLWAPQYIAKRP